MGNGVRRTYFDQNSLIFSQGIAPSSYRLTGAEFKISSTEIIRRNSFYVRFFSQIIHVTLPYHQLDNFRIIISVDAQALFPLNL